MGIVTIMGNSCSMVGSSIIVKSLGVMAAANAISLLVAKKKGTFIHTFFDFPVK